MSDAHKKISGPGAFTLGKQLEKQAAALHAEALKIVSEPKSSSGFQELYYGRLADTLSLIATDLTRHEGNLPEERLNEILNVTEEVTIQHIVRNITSLEDRKQMLNLARSRYAHWDGEPTRFEQFLTVKGLFENGHTNAEEYIQKHDQLRKEYRDLYGHTKAVKQELHLFDQIFQLQMYDLNVTEHVKQLFNKRAEEEIGTIPSAETGNTARIGSVSSSSPTFLNSVTVLPSSLIRELKNHLQDLIDAYSATPEILNTQVRLQFLEALHTSLRLPSKMTLKQYKKMHSDLVEKTGYSIEERGLSPKEENAAYANLYRFADELDNYVSAKYETHQKAIEKHLIPPGNDALPGMSVN